MSSANEWLTPSFWHCTTQTALHHDENHVDVVGCCIMNCWSSNAYMYLLEGISVDISSTDLLLVGIIIVHHSHHLCNRPTGPLQIIQPIQIQFISSSTQNHHKVVILVVHRMATRWFASHTFYTRGRTISQSVVSSIYFISYHVDGRPAHSA